MIDKYQFFQVFLQQNTYFNVTKCDIMLICDYETINAFVGTNNALNTFYLQCVRNMVKDHSYSEIGNQLSSLHGLLFLISSKGFFIRTIYRQNNTYHNIVTPVMEHWLE